MIKVKVFQKTKPRIIRGLNFCCLLNYPYSDNAVDSFDIGFNICGNIGIAINDRVCDTPYGSFFYSAIGGNFSIVYFLRFCSLLQNFLLFCLIYSC